MHWAQREKKPLLLKVRKADHFHFVLWCCWFHQSNAPLYIHFLHRTWCWILSTAAELPSGHLEPWSWQIHHTIKPYSKEVIEKSSLLPKKYNIVRGRGIILIVASCRQTKSICRHQKEWNPIQLRIVLQVQGHHIPSFHIHQQRWESTSSIISFQFQPHQRMHDEAKPRPSISSWWPPSWQCRDFHCKKLWIVPLKQRSW